MFYEFENGLTEIEYKNINPNNLTVGCISSEELITYGRELGFDEETIEASQKANLLFRTGVDVHEEYTFAEIRIVNRDGHEDFISIYVKKNFLLIVDIIDEDNSTIDSFMKALRRYPVSRVNEERLIYCFIESLLAEGTMISEEIRNNLTEMEESIVNGKALEKLNVKLLELKKKILKYYNEKLDFDVKLSPQVIRNSFAAHMVQNGADLRSLQELLGHADIGTTQIYTHVDTARFGEIHRRFHPRA